MPLLSTTFEAIGTKWLIDAYSQVPEEKWQNTLQKINDLIEAFDKAYSRFRADSLVTRMSKSAGRYALPRGGQKMLEFYQQLYRATDGRLTPLIGQTLSDAGYDAGYSFKTKLLARPPKWDKALSLDGGVLTLKQAALLDFGAAGKGQLIHLVGDLISAAGIVEFVINAGGDLLHRAPPDKKISIGLENPLKEGQVIGIVRLGSQSLCASAGNRRAWGKFHHILDPSTLKSPDKIIATWAIADDAMTADGLATALFFTSPKRLSMFKFSYAILRPDMSLEYSKDFPVETLEA